MTVVRANILWSPTALLHLESIYDYILVHNPAAALSVHEEIERAVRRLADHPRLGRPGRVKGTRELVVSTYPSYILVYEIEGRTLHILAVMHNRQSWPDDFSWE